MPTWNTAIVQTSKWPTQEKHFHAGRLVLYLLINNSYTVVAIDDRFFSYLKQDSYKTIPMPTVYGDCRPVLFFLHEFSHKDGYAR